VADILKKVVSNAGGGLSQMRVLDVGAGNGIMAEALIKLGVARIVGLDILEDAKLAAERDRPGLYDAYYALDLSKMSNGLREEFSEWHLNCMTTVAALGFGDIPARAFLEAYNLIDENGWIAFNIKETFLENRDTSGFSVFVKNLILTDHFDIHHLERYQHRLSIDGAPLYYYAAVGKKNRNIEPSFLATLSPG
jgi:predicted TPR repeat methyltransferase